MKSTWGGSQWHFSNIWHIRYQECAERWYCLCFCSLGPDTKVQSWGNERLLLHWTCRATWSNSCFTVWSSQSEFTLGCCRSHWQWRSEINGKKAVSDIDLKVANLTQNVIAQINQLITDCQQLSSSVTAHSCTYYAQSSINTSTSSPTQTVDRSWMLSFLVSLNHRQFHLTSVSVTLHSLQDD